MLYLQYWGEDLNHKHKGNKSVWIVREIGGQLRWTKNKKGEKNIIQAGKDTETVEPV